MTDDEGRPDSPAGNRPNRKKPVYGDVRWVNPTLNNDDRAWLESNDNKLDTLFFEVLDSMGDDDKLSVKYDGHTNRWTAIYFGGPDNDENAGAALSVRGATAYDACVLLGYFHLRKFNRSWGDANPEPQGRWG